MSNEVTEVEEGSRADVVSSPASTSPSSLKSNFIGPSFLTEDDETSDRVRCPIHGFIRFSPNERLVINHPIFQRLRMIRQLALTEFIYPGATHTRFGHSMGVMEIATQAFDSLCSKQGPKMESVFKQVVGFENDTLAKARQILRLAALLHDVGHVAFSHAAEKTLHKEMGHEAFSEKIIREPELLGGLLVEHFGDDVPQHVASLISKQGPVPQFKVLQDIVSGLMDADRTDYLLRDSLYCGVEYGRFDFRRLLDSMDLIDNHGELQIALKREGIHAFEALILARYQMSVQVYYHRLRSVYDHYLERYFEAVPEGPPTTVDELLGLNDFHMLDRIHRDARDSSLPQHRWAERIANRRHHREIFATGMGATIGQVRIAAELTQRLSDKYTDVHIFQVRAKANIHKLVLPDDMDDAGRVDLKLIRPYGMEVSVTEESQIFPRLPRDFQCVRVFADVEPTSALRSEIRSEALRLWKEMGGR